MREGEVAIRSSDAGSRCVRDGVTVVTGTVTGNATKARSCATVSHAHTMNAVQAVFISSIQSDYAEARAAVRRGVESLGRLPR